jgi:tetratricopeptide (TPR) repeat protein
MMRSDHSMRPPMPSATIKYQSPNACNMCHKDKDAQWADKHVRKWHKEDYQKPVMEIADLIDQARKGKWKNLPNMLDYLQKKDKDEIFANSLIRLLRGHYDIRIAKVLTKLLKDDPSPLIRSSVADGMESYLNASTVPLLAAAAKDPSLLVRIRAVPTLAYVPENMIPADIKKPVQQAFAEYVQAMGSRPDDAMAHYNLGNYYAAKNESKQAIRSYETSIKLQNDLVLPYVNASLVYNRLGDNNTAAARLNQAIAIDPNSTAAHLNLALLYGEMGQKQKSIEHFRTTFKLDPKSSTAAFNLSVLLAEKDITQTVQWAKRALELEPKNAKYAYTLAFYLSRQGRVKEVIDTLQPFVNRKTTDVNIYMMLGGIYERASDIAAAIGVYEVAVQNEQLPNQVRSQFAAQLQRLISQ